MKTFSVEENGDLRVGEDTFFANPFVVGKMCEIDWIPKFHPEDSEKYILYGPILTPRDAYYLFVRYGVRQFLENPQALKALKDAKRYICSCEHGRWCIANALNLIFKSKYEIPSEQISDGLLVRIERRGNRRKRT